MANKHGNLSIDSDNLFPIIKKWLYSDHDIFYRELISNGCDAITKLKKLDMMGEYSLPADFKAKIQVIVNPEEKTLKFIDNGLGMTFDEVEEYINQIAFSGATEFLEKIIQDNLWEKCEACNKHHYCHIYRNRNLIVENCPVCDHPPGGYFRKNTNGKGE